MSYQNINDIRNSEFISNFAFGNGGGICSINSNFTFVNVSFSYNNADIGGAVFYSDFTPYAMFLRERIKVENIYLT